MDPGKHPQQRQVHLAKNGYAAFTVSATSRAAVREYITNQEEHHRTKSFREELVAMLDKAGIPYDPKYFD